MQQQQLPYGGLHNTPCRPEGPDPDVVSAGQPLDSTPANQGFASATNPGPGSYSPSPNYLSAEKQGPYVRPADNGGDPRGQNSGAKRGGCSSALDDLKENPAKVFVGGLQQHTTADTLRAYFTKYGEIEDVAIVIDKATGRSRGFGFCTFTTKAAVDACLRSAHSLDGVPCEVRRAIPREQARERSGLSVVAQPGKAFVGGLSETISEEAMIRYFGRFGRVKEATLMYDRVSHRPRGFAFVVFESAEDVYKVIGQHPELGRTCEVKHAEPRPMDISGRRQFASNGESSYRPARRHDAYPSRSYGTRSGSFRGYDEPRIGPYSTMNYSAAPPPYLATRPPAMSSSYSEREFRGSMRGLGGSGGRQYPPYRDSVVGRGSSHHDPYDMTPPEYYGPPQGHHYASHSPPHNYGFFREPCVSRSMDVWQP